MTPKIPQFIELKGVRTHNLKNLDVKIPKNKWISITGPSGSGKTSLAIDTLHAESQNRLLDSLSSSRAKTELRLGTPLLDSGKGLSPTVCLSQGSLVFPNRSTLGTTTEITPLLQSLYQNQGTFYSPKTQTPLFKTPLDDIPQGLKDIALRNGDDSQKLMILSPIHWADQSECEQLLKDLKSEGFLRIFSNGETYLLDSLPHEVLFSNPFFLVIDRIIIKPKIEWSTSELGRLMNSLELSLEKGTNVTAIYLLNSKEIHYFSPDFFDPSTCVSYPTFSQKTFSFTHKEGACANCIGHGTLQQPNPNLYLQSQLSAEEGGLFPWTSSDKPWKISLLELCKNQLGAQKNLWSSPLQTWPSELINNTLGRSKKSKSNSPSYLEKKLLDILPSLPPNIQREMGEYFQNEICPTCQGERLGVVPMNTTIEGLTIGQVSNKSINDIFPWINKLNPETSNNKSPNDLKVLRHLIPLILDRLEKLQSLGLGYLPLNRSLKDLSGGELQRTRLMSQWARDMSGLTYVFDEPSRGLHPEDLSFINLPIKNPLNQGNTVITVEHQPSMMVASEFNIDMGPGSGPKGGEIQYSGKTKTPSFKSSQLGKYLSKKKPFSGSKNKSNLPKEYQSPLKITTRPLHNLKEFKVEIPWGQISVITGVSGSGKTTFAKENLLPLLKSSELHPRNKGELQFQGMTLDKVPGPFRVCYLDSFSIGSNKRSNPAIFTGIFQIIRQLFASTKEAKIKGYGPERFSFNLKGGRCETCKGQGETQMSLDTLDPFSLICENCSGSGYNKETLGIKFKGYHIEQILDLTFGEAERIFKSISTLKKKLELFNSLGLSYLKLGQPTRTLSGGECQRLKLIVELGKESRIPSIYILDEPTSGLHFEDIAKLNMILRGLASNGHILLVIDHHMEVLRNADWFIELGPGAGPAGGNLIDMGNLEKIIATKTLTSKWLSIHEKGYL